MITHTVLEGHPDMCCYSFKKLSSMVVNGGGGVACPAKSRLAAESKSSSSKHYLVGFARAGNYT